MTASKRGRDPIVRRLLPLLPPLAIPLNGALRVSAPVAGGRGRELVILNPTAIRGELSMRRASVLDVYAEDADLELFTDPMLDERLKLSLGDDPALRYVRDWVLNRGRGIGGPSTVGTQTRLRFWGAGEAALKAKTGRKTWPASRMNYAALVTALAAEVADEYPLGVVVSRPNSTPPRETDSASDDVTGSDGSSGSLGWSTETAAKVTVAGVKATPEQLRNIDTVLRRCVAKKAPALATWGTHTANIGESKCLVGATNPSSGAKGIFQLLPSTARSFGLDPSDTEACADQFLEHGYTYGKNGGRGAIYFARTYPDMSPGTIASKVEGSDQGGAFYDKHAGEARRNIELWAGVTLDRWHTVTGPAGTSDPRDESAASEERPSVWRRGSDEANESSWTMLGRNAEGLGRGRFVSAKRIVSDRDQDLIIAAPHMVIKPRDSVLKEVGDIDVSENAQLAQVSLTVMRDGWAAPHGSVVDLSGFGRAASKAWLVESIRFAAGSPEIEVDLCQPKTKIPSGGGVNNSSKVNEVSLSVATTDGGAKGIVERAATLAAQVGGSPVYVCSDYRPGSTTTSGNASDHGSNNETQAARDIAVRGIDANVGPPSPKLDAAVVAIGKTFGRNYGDGGQRIVDTFTWKGFRIQIIWRTPEFGGHMGHIHIGARKL